jgi:hypothetical protein
MSSILGIIASSMKGVSGAFESIASASGTGSSDTITFSSIPSTYKHLQIRAMGRSTGTDANPAINFNGDSGSNYAYHYLFGTGASVIASGSASVTRIGDVLWATNSSNAANTMGLTLIDIHNYSSTTQNKTVRIFSGRDLNGSGGNAVLMSGLWMNTNAITSVSIKLTELTNFWTTSSVFSLYGIKG